MKITPHFVSSAKGRIFCLERIPDSQSPQRLLVLVPPFAEEMNKSRHMVTLISQALVNQNHGLALFDLYGTGDSEGVLSDATLESWRHDLEVYLKYLKRAYECPLDVLCLRFGALIYLGSQESLALTEDVHLWNPVLNGKLFMAQFFRMRIAAEMMRPLGDKLTMQNLIDEMGVSEFIEVGGYPVSQELYDSIATFAIDVSSLRSIKKRCFITEISPQTKKDVSSVIQNFISELVGVGWDAVAGTSQGDTFWSTQEISKAEAPLTTLSNFYVTNRYEY